MTDARSYRFPRSRRLSGRRAFGRVFQARAKKNVGPLAIHALPNQLSHPRLGLSVSRKVGNAVARNRVKRLLREAFRLSQHDWPRGYDIVVVVYPHELLTLADYQRILFSGVRSMHLTWTRRSAKQ